MACAWRLTVLQNRVSEALPLLYSMHLKSVKLCVWGESTSDGEIHDNHTSESQRDTFCLNSRLNIAYFYNPRYSFRHHRTCPEPTGTGKFTKSKRAQYTRQGQISKVLWDFAGSWCRSPQLVGGAARQTPTSWRLRPVIHASSQRPISNHNQEKEN